MAIPRPKISRAEIEARKAERAEGFRTLWLVVGGALAVALLVVLLGGLLGKWQKAARLGQDAGMTDVGFQLLLIAVPLLLWGALAALTAHIAALKGYDRTPWFVLAFLFNPWVLLAAMIMGNRAAKTMPAAPFEPERMPCPQCGESIPTAAKVCRFCQHSLTPQ